MKLNRTVYRDKVLGCWLGKNVGGTIGAPFEWRRQVNDVTFYTQPDMNGQPMPNDDLDIQLLWLCAMEEKGIDVNAHRLAEYWLTYVTPHWSEYGTAKTNMRQGLPPPLSGTFQNPHKHSCGAYIRSEIWACIAPGNPAVAARYAYEDAILDHGNGEGTYAEIFMATLESAAFVMKDLKDCVEVGLSFIPKDCGVAKAVATVFDCFAAKKSWLETRHEVLRLHRGSLWAVCVSAEDKARGFDTGTAGYDVPSNIALTLVGLLWGGDDFGAVQCICVNCGEDTDCTAATAGSVWGILHGAKAIPQKWIDPIGRGIRTVCLNLGELGYFGNQLPQTVDELTDRSIALAERMCLNGKTNVAFTEDAASAEAVSPEVLFAKDEGRSVWGGATGPRYDFDDLTVHLDYGDEPPLVRPGEPKKIGVTLTRTGKIQQNLTLQWHTPEGWMVSPSRKGYRLLAPEQNVARLDFTFTPCDVSESTFRLVLEITMDGRPCVFHVPVVFLNGTLYS